MTQEPTLELEVDKQGTRWWWFDGHLHRTLGPAVEWANGDRWWILNDRLYTFQEWLDETPVDEPTRLLLMLKYGTYTNS